MSLYDIHKNNYRKGLVQFVGNFMFITVGNFATAVGGTVIYENKFNVCVGLIYETV